MTFTNGNSRVGCGRALPMVMGVLSFAFAALAQQHPPLKALAGGVGPWIVPAASSGNQNRKVKAPRARNRKAKKTLRSAEKQMKSSDKKNTNSRNAGTTQKGRKSVAGSGEATTDSGVAQPRKTTGDRKPSDKPKDRDKMLDEVNLPIPVPPGEVRNSRPSPSNRPDINAPPTRSRKKASCQSTFSKPPRRKHEKQTNPAGNE